MQSTYSRLITTLSVLSLFVSVCVLPGAAWAEKGVITPGIKVKGTYNDNSHFVDKTDFELLTIPSLILKYGQEDWEISSGISSDIYRNRELTEYDRENYSLWLKGGKSLTERLRINCDATFDYDHTSKKELEESGYVTALALRRSYSLRPGVSWGMTEKDQISLSLPYSETVYTGSNNADSATKGGVVDWSHVMNNERMRLLGQLSYNNNYFDRTDGYTDQDVYKVMGGVYYRPSELFEVTAYMGLGHSRSEVTFNALEDSKGSNTYFTLDVSGTYSREKWKFTLGADRQASPSTDGELTLRTRVFLSGQYSFSERLFANLNSAYYETESGGLISDSKKRTYYLGPSVGYHWTEDATIRLQFRHTNTKNLLTGKEQRQNWTALRFEYRYPWSF